MFKNVILLFALLGLSACASKENVKKLLKENPEILTEAIKANPGKIIMALNEAARAAQADMAKNREAEEAKAIEDSIENPLKPTIRDTDTFRGPK